MANKKWWQVLLPATLIFLLTLSACARLPRQDPVTSPITLGSVLGDCKTNPNWSPAVKNAEFAKVLQKILHLNTYSNTKYVLNVQLIELSRPSFGMNIKIDCVVNYQLFKDGVRKPILNKTIYSSYTATKKDAYMAEKQKRIAYDRAVKKNIMQFAKVIQRSAAIVEWRH